MSAIVLQDFKLLGTYNKKTVSVSLAARIGMIPLYYISLWKASEGWNVVEVKPNSLTSDRLSADPACGQV